MSKTFQVFALSEVVSPLTHMMRVEGNEALINREPVTTPAGIRYIPFISGNAFRHRLVRDPGAWHLIDTWELSGKLSMAQLNFLFHGGSLTEGGGRENTDRIARMNRLFPLLRLLGGCLPNQILSGSLKAHRGMMCCEENRERVGRCLPDEWRIQPRKLRAAESFVDAYQYTRGDAMKTAPSALPPISVDAPSNLMIFSGQQVISGAMFAHGFVAENVGELEMGALFLSLRIWQSGNGTIGGQSSRGHGRIKTEIHVTPDLDEEAAVHAYVEHVSAVKDEAIAFFNECFAAPAAKPEKGKKAKKGVSHAPDESNLLA